MASKSENVRRFDRFAEVTGADFVDDPGARYQVSRALESSLRAEAERAVGRYGEPAAELIDQLPESWWFSPERLRVVITGFAPFRRHRRNPSWDVARSLAGQLDTDFQTQVKRLEVTYGDVEAFADSLDWSRGQLLAIHVGLGSRRERVCLERFAHNCRGKTPDESERGDYPPYLDPAGPAALQTHLPLDAFARRCDNWGGETSLPEVAVSRDAGDYVCNCLYYRSLTHAHRTRRQHRSAEAVFIHVPQLDEETAETLGARLGGAIGDQLDDALGR